MLIGNCADCNDCGKIGTQCMECPYGYGEYVDEVPTGTCPSCRGQGIRYAQCSMCVDASNTYD
jgi:hypothetical protein